MIAIRVWPEDELHLVGVSLDQQWSFGYVKRTDEVDPFAAIWHGNSITAKRRPRVCYVASETSHDEMWTKETIYSLYRKWDIWLDEDQPETTPPPISYI